MNTTLQHNVVVGDFNFPPKNVSWLTTQDDGIVPDPTTCHTSQEKTQLEQLLELVDKRHLHQVIDTPIRGKLFKFRLKILA